MGEARRKVPQFVMPRITPLDERIIVPAVCAILDREREGLGGVVVVEGREDTTLYFAEAPGSDL